jgi:hypothetical protein
MPHTRYVGPTSVGLEFTPGMWAYLCGFGIHTRYVGPTFVGLEFTPGMWAYLR